MKIEKALKARNNGMQKLNDLYTLTTRMKLPSDQFNLRYSMIINKLPKSSPSWVEAYLQGAAEIMRKRIQQELTEFCYIIEGKKYSVRIDSPDYYEKHGIEPGDLADKKNGQYWIDSHKHWYKGKK